MVVVLTVAAGFLHVGGGSVDPGLFARIKENKRSMVQQDSQIIGAASTWTKEAHCNIFQLCWRRWDGGEIHEEEASGLPPPKPAPPKASSTKSK